MHGLRGVTLTARFLCELAMVLGVAGIATSLLNEAQERREGPEGIRRR
jgi:hypothetical protein